MKTLVKHTIPILVIVIWVVLAVIISLSSCTKDKLPVVDRPGQLKEVQKIVLPGPAVDITLSAYTSFDPGTSFELTIDRIMIARFNITQTENMKWHFDKLNAGIHRVNIYTSVNSNSTSGFCNFRFNINNGTESMSVDATKVDQNNYAFDLEIQ
jgi:hypothetical protein